MAGGVESWSSSSAEREAKLGMVMEFSLDDGGVAAVSFSSSPKLPRRLRRRLSESKTPQKCTIQDIEAKLRHADLRRQIVDVGLNLVVYKSLKECLIRTKPFGLIEDSKLSVTRLACDVAEGTVGQTDAYPLDVI
ncbi:t-complex protein 11-like protein 1 [Fagus crenata]